MMRERRTRLIGRCGWLMVSLLLLAWQPVWAAKNVDRVALVIGNYHYTDLKHLQNPGRDAKAMAKRLRALNFQLLDQRGKPTNQPVLNLNETHFTKAIRYFSKQAKGKKMALVYYAGHGMQFGSSSYLLPIDVPADDLELAQKNSISLDGLLKRLDGKAELTIAVFDACREIPELAEAVDEVVRDSGYGKNDFRGLARVKSKGRNRIVAYSGAAGQLVADGQGQHSPYTALLLTELEQPGLEVGDLFRRVAYRFGEKHDRQQPEVLIQGVPPQHYFFLPKKYRPAPDPVPLPPPLQLTGHLQVNVSQRQQPLTVWVNSEKRGTVSTGNALNLTHLPVGSVRVVVKDKKGRTQQQTVKIKANQWVQPLFVWQEEEAQPVQRATTLEVATQPAGATVRVLNIKAKYRAGMTLKPGRYQIEVSKTGYLTKTRWVTLVRNSPLWLEVTLEEISESSVRKPQHGDRWLEPITQMAFIYVRSGCFQMGSPEQEKGRYSDEGPVHQVCVDGFWLAEHEVTNQQYRRYRSGHDSGKYKKQNLNGDPQPVVQVSYEEATEFATWLSNRSGQQFRLPTEAEWEYAARGGTKSARFWGISPDLACQYGNVYDQTSKRKNGFNWTHHRCDDGYAVTSPVGRFKANPFGLQDMLGNVWEWVGDWYSKDYYGQRLRQNPEGPSTGASRVVRGGGWGSLPALVRSAYRYNYDASYRRSNVGFRLLRSYP